MELANCTLALGGDQGNTILKFDVTPSEVAVLQLIHGNDAVTELEITREEHRSGRDERERLSQNYGKSEEGTFRARAVDQLFPGVAARLFDKFEELDLDDSFYKAERKAPRKSAKDPLDHDNDNDGRKGGSVKPEPNGSNAEGPEKAAETKGGKKTPRKKGSDKNTSVPDVEKTPDGSIESVKGADGTDAHDATQDEGADAVDEGDDDGIGEINDGANTIFK